MNWYYAQGDQRVGPVTANELSRLGQVGNITPATLVWREGWSDWRAFGDSAPAISEETGKATCVECGKQFPISDMVQFEGSWVCPTCKPIFFQKIKEGVAIRTDLSYAGFWIRFLAKFIDGIILQLVFFVLGLGIGLVLASMTKNSNAQLGVALVTWSLSIAMAASYETFFVGKLGATPGKMACRLRVVTAAGERLTYLRALARYFSTILSGIILCIGYIMAAFDDEKRALHDRICDTRVIRLNA